MRIIILEKKKSLMSFPSENSVIMQLYAQWISSQNQLLMDTIWQNHQNLVMPYQEKAIFAAASTSESEQAVKQEPEAEKVVAKKQKQRKEVAQKKSEPRKKRQNNDANFYPKKQKKNRNVISNLVHHLLKFLYQKDQVLEYVQQIISIHQLNISVERFYQLLDIFNERMKSYVTEVHFRELLVGKTKELQKHQENEVQEFSKILRVVCNKFYKKECYQSIIYSVKLTFESKDLHYIGMREIRTILNFLSCGERLREGAENIQQGPIL